MHQVLYSENIDIVINKYSDWIKSFRHQSGCFLIDHLIVLIISAMNTIAFDFIVINNICK